jgi:polyisoprenoid-binding protein YceI
MARRKLLPVLWLLAATVVYAGAGSAQKAPIAAAAAKQVSLSVDAGQCKAHYEVDTTLHTVHGTFNVKSGSVQFDPQTGKADGLIVVFATSGDSGNASRDEKMHKEVLESWKFQEATFRPTQVDGAVSLTGTSDFKLKGVFNLHGGDHDIVTDVHTEFSGGHWKGTAKFDVPFIDWKIKDPSNFLLKVKPVVQVEVDLTGDVK